MNASTVNTLHGSFQGLPCYHVSIMLHHLLFESSDVESKGPVSVRTKIHFNRAITISANARKQGLGNSQPQTLMILHPDQLSIFCEEKSRVEAVAGDIGYTTTNHITCAEFKTRISTTPTCTPTSTCDTHANQRRASSGVAVEEFSVISVPGVREFVPSRHLTQGEALKTRRRVI